MLRRDGERKHQRKKKNPAKKAERYKNRGGSETYFWCHRNVSGEKRERESEGLIREVMEVACATECRHTAKVTGKQAKLVQSSASSLPAAALLEL